MQNTQIDALCQMLAGEEPLLHYPGREAAALLAPSSGVPTDIAALRRGPFGRLAARGPVRDLVARAGGGVVSPDALAVLAAPDAVWPTSRLGRAAQAIAAARPWHYFRRSFAVWQADRQTWHWRQVSRPGGNLVLQMGFPAEHDIAFYRLFGPRRRGRFECESHPVRRKGPITMAWARLAIPFKGACRDADWEEDLLVEEIQSDWFRLVDHTVKRMTATPGPKGKDGLARYTAYEQAHLALHRRDWAEATLMAVIDLARRELGIKRLWMPQPAAGAALKGIDGTLPPASIYTALPRRFCFEPTTDAPPFLEKPRFKTLRALRRKGRPLFWRLELA